MQRESPSRNETSIQIPQRLQACKEVREALDVTTESGLPGSSIHRDEPVDTEKESKATGRAILMVRKCEIGLVKDQYGEPFATIPAGAGHVNVPIRGKEFGSYVRSTCFRQELILSTKQLEEVVSHFEALAEFGGEARELHVRSARHDRDIFYDLGNGGAVQVRPGSGFEITSSVPPIFRKYSIQASQVHPRMDETTRLDDLFECVNVRDPEQKLLTKVFLVAALVPDIPRPILAIHGPQGSAKSSFSRALVSLLDPCKTDDVGIKNTDEFTRAATHRMVLPIDNVSRVNEETSDLFCKLVTGTGITRRKLYSDDDDVIRSMRRVIILNGINLPLDRSDVLDRCLLIELQSISEENRCTETHVREAFEAHKPYILGSMFETLSKAIAKLDSVPNFPLPRMADFARYGYAISESIGISGHEFIRAYEGNIARQCYEALSSSPVGACIMNHFEGNGGKLSGTPTSVWEALKGRADFAGVDPHRFPSNVKSFGHHLNRLKPNLERMGFVVVEQKSGERFLSIYKRP